MPNKYNYWLYSVDNDVSQKGKPISFGRWGRGGGRGWNRCQFKNQGDRNRIRVILKCFNFISLKKNKNQRTKEPTKTTSPNNNTTTMVQQVHRTTHVIPQTHTRTLVNGMWRNEPKKLWCIWLFFCRNVLGRLV